LNVEQGISKLRRLEGKKIRTSDVKLSRNEERLQYSRLALDSIQGSMFNILRLKIIRKHK